MDLHPKLADPIVLRVAADREYRSRVVDLGVGLLVVAQAYDQPSELTPVSGSELTVVWTAPDGIARGLPTRMLNTSGDGADRRWSLAVTGPAQIELRRRTPRVIVHGPVAVRPATGAEDSDPVIGSLVDLSEHGVRFRVGVGEADTFLAGATDVIAEFALENTEFAIPGRAEFLRASSKPTELEELVVVFDEPVTDAEALREYIATHREAAPADDH